MMRFSALNFIPPLVSFILALGLTPVVRLLAHRRGFVARPKIDRWHKNATATIGGVARWPIVGFVYLILIPHTAHGLVNIRGRHFLVFGGLLDELNLSK